LKAWSIVLFFVCLNLAGFVVSNLVDMDVLPASKEVIMPYSIDNLKGQFSLSLVAGLLAGGAVAGLIGIMLKQYTFGVLAGAIWVCGLLFTIGQWVLMGIDILMKLLLAGTGLEWLSDVIYVGVLVAFFALLAETLSSKPLT
jgi:hypothetical protein